MRNVLVTGASGQIGKSLCSELEKRGFQVFKCARNTQDSIFSFNLENDRDKLLNCLKITTPQIIFHAAGALMSTDPLNLYRTNVQMAVQLVQAIAQLPFDQRPLLVNLSSAAELGDIPDSIEFVTEDYQCQPISDYGVSKLCQSTIILAAARRIGFRTINARIFNCLDFKNSPVQLWINKIKVIMQNTAKPVLHVGNLKILRDFLNIETIVRIIVDLSCLPKAEGIINIGSGIGTVLQEIVNNLRELSVPFEIFVDPTFLRQQDVKCVIANTSKLENLLGRPIRFDLRAALINMLK